MKLLGSMAALIVYWACSHNATAQTIPHQFVMDSIVVVGKKTRGLYKKASGQYELKVQDLKTLPKIMGNADPVRYLQYLPGVQSNSEYDSGLHIQGCDNEHNEVAMDGVTVYQPTHLLGLFSVFNPSHFPAIDLNLNSSATASNRLGGKVDMLLQQKMEQRVNGELTVGPMSAQGTLRVPMTRRLTVVGSARVSYLNLLYQPWLKFEDTKLHYDFMDFNLTALYRVTDRDQIWLNAYWGRDKTRLDEAPTQASLRLDWTNWLASLHWKHSWEKGFLNQKFYTTHYLNHLSLAQQDRVELLPSSVRDIGYEADLSFPIANFGAKMLFHHIRPQVNENWVVREGKKYENQHTQEYSLSARLHHKLADVWTLGAGAKLVFYIDPYKEHFIDVLPEATIEYASGPFKAKLAYGYQKQYLFQTGFTDMGMPTEYWVSCNRKIRPQSAHSFSLSADLDLGEGDWSVSASAYYKHLDSQVEYIGSVLDILDTEFDLNEKILSGKGNNYGMSVMLNKKTGKLTGWLEYSWGRAFRYFTHPDFPDVYPANHERPHELNLVASYLINPRWEVGGTFVVASGTPFTAPEHFYMNNGNMMTEFGPHNANRLRPYIRLDLSVNYNFKKTARRESGINFSLYNVTMHKNDLFYMIKFKDGQFAYSPFRFVFMILPSVSYYYKF